MTALQSALSLVKHRFPSDQSLIEDLYGKDADFTSLCSDLFLCSNMIHDIEQEIAEKKHTLTEYRDIVTELEKELSMVIHSAGKDGSINQ